MLYISKKKIRKEVIREYDALFINPGDNLIVRIVKRTLNFVRWYFYYASIAFFVFVTLIIVIISFLPA